MGATHKIWCVAIALHVSCSTHWRVYVCPFKFVVISYIYWKSRSEWIHGTCIYCQYSLPLKTVSIVLATWFIQWVLEERTRLYNKLSYFVPVRIKFYHSKHADLLYSEYYCRKWLIFQKAVKLLTRVLQPP